MALRPDIAHTDAMPPGSTMAAHDKVGRLGNILGMPMIFSGIVLVTEGDDVEIPGVSNARNHWLEAARVHNHTTGATWELNLRRVAVAGACRSRWLCCSS